MNQPTYMFSYVPCCKCGALTQVRQVYDKHLSAWVDSTIRICYDCRKKEGWKCWKGAGMTNEEAKKWLTKLLLRADITDDYGDLVDMQPYEEAVNAATKALDQAAVLDKIKAEIWHFMFDINPSSSESDYACNYMLDIINKYKDRMEREE